MSHPASPHPFKDLVFSLHVLAIPMGAESSLPVILTYILFRLTFYQLRCRSFHFPSIIFSKIAVCAFTFSNQVVLLIIVEYSPLSINLSQLDK